MLPAGTLPPAHAPRGDPSLEHLARFSHDADLAFVLVHVDANILQGWPPLLRLLPAACEVHRFAEHEVELTVGFSRWDSRCHSEGTDVKAVTYHAARFDSDGAVWRAQVLLDI